jgi:hypothetical protein
MYFFFLMQYSLFIKILSLGISLLLFNCLHAQPVEGLWIGSLKTKGTQVHYELWITKDKEIYSGYALSLMVIDGVENIGVKAVKLKLKNKVLLLEDDALVYNNFKTPPKKSKLIARLYTKEGSDSLTGTFNTRSLDFTDRTSYEGDLELIRSSDKNNSLLLGKLAHLSIVTENAVAVSSENQIKENKDITVKEVTEVIVPSDNETSIIKKNTASIIEAEAPKQINKPAIEAKPAKEIRVFDPFENRRIEIIETVFVSLDSVTISLYDNGIVDGDTVSIYVNGKMHLEKKELGTAAIRSTIYFPSTLVDSLELIMYAENLGTIPPNTGLLIIQDGNTRHEIRFSGDLQKNAAIILRRKK